MKKLTKQEIYRRNQERRNLRKLHKNAIESNNKLREENKELKERIRQLEENSARLERIIVDQNAIIAELREMVYGKKGKKKKDKDEEGNEPKDKSNGDNKKKPRGKDTYQREIPQKSDITQTEKHKLKCCPECKGKLSRKRIITYYVEDIPLPTEENKLKTVYEHQVEKGYCNKCKKWHTAVPLPSKKVIIGERVKIYICYLSILMRLSYEQIQNILRDTYMLKISDGEIANILEEKSQQWRIVYERIKKILQTSEGVNMDETGWGKRRLWVMISILTDDVIYLVSETRGKGNAEKLLGDSFNQVRVSDAYPVYKNLKGKCQLCWGHPHRYLRTLKDIKGVKKSIKTLCINSYENFSAIYEDLREYLKEDFNPTKRQKQKQDLIGRLNSFCKPNKKDPKKLVNIKNLFTDRLEEYLTCMDYEGVPCDNNKAERALRHFVIKRVISFGNKSDNGAKAFEINASVLMTYWKRYPNSFFAEMMKISNIEK